SRLGHGVAAETREANGQACGKFLRAEIMVNGVSPFLRRSVEKLQARTIEPEDARLLRRGLDLGSKAHQTLGQFAHRLISYGRRDFAGAQRGRQRKSGGIAQTRENAMLACFFVDPENQSLRLAFR